MPGGNDCARVAVVANHAPSTLALVDTPHAFRLVCDAMAACSYGHGRAHMGGIVGRHGLWRWCARRVRRRHRRVCLAVCSVASPSLSPAAAAPAAPAASEQTITTSTRDAAPRTLQPVPMRYALSGPECAPSTATAISLQCGSRIPATPGHCPRIPAAATLPGIVVSVRAPYSTSTATVPVPPASPALRNGSKAPARAPGGHGQGSG